jgi:hypothetical protein
LLAAPPGLRPGPERKKLLRGQGSGRFVLDVQGCGSQDRRVTGASRSPFVSLVPGLWSHCLVRAGTCLLIPIRRLLFLSPAGPAALHLRGSSSLSLCHRPTMPKQIRPKKTRKARKKISRTLPVIHPDAAGADISATEIWVAVPADRDEESVRSFGPFTEDLLALAEWLSRCGITSVAMESTSVYWIPLFLLLEEQGFEVCLVNAHHVKNVPGRKTDVLDCQWLQSCTPSA